MGEHLMDEMLIAFATISLVAGVVGALIGLELQHRRLAKPIAQQEKRFAELEAKVAAQIEQIQKEWKAWEAEDTARVEALVEQYDAAVTWLNLERELARLPRVEEIPVARSTNGYHDHTPTNWRLPTFHRANLSGRDLSHRYLGRA